MITSWRRLGRGWVVAGALLVVAVPNAFAAMYKWVDENGRVQYTQTPPPEGRFNQLKAPPPPPSAAAAQKQLQDLLAKQEAERAQREAEKKGAQASDDNQAQLTARCNEAKGQLVVLVNSPPGRVTVEGADGTIHRLTEEEHASRLAEVKKIISESCGK